ncbi:MAG TPA: GlsB/YeaQ/YmgE family stress response membrane protein [Opitutaceae bacterium]|jgi:uncharacterized membrane protein YeaQ/YmgE (transglycosylase-associated protein family)
MILVYFIIYLIIGGLAGWCAGVIMKGRGFGVIGNIFIGIFGSFLGGLCFRLVGIVAFGIVGQFIFALVGALLFLWIIRLIVK